jgi:hypothetical protein
VYIALSEKCVCDQGFCGEFGVSTSVTGDIEAASKARPHAWWGVSSPEMAEQYGYREISDAQWLTTVQTTHQPEPEGYREALYGEGIQAEGFGGCIGYAEDVIYEGAELTRQEEDAIQGEVFLQIGIVSRQDPGVAAAAASWSECMAADGYDYADPHEAYAQFVTSTDGCQYMFNHVRPRLEDDEKRIAVADATCKGIVEFWDVVYAAEDAAEATVAESMRTDIDKVKATHARYLENAMAALETLDLD